MSRRQTLLFTAILLLAGAAGLALGLSQREPARAAAAIPVVQASAQALMGQTRPGFELPDLEGRTRSVDEWDGKVLLVNFWATWCPPCKKEIPDLIRLQSDLGERGLVVVGIAIDQRDLVRDFASSMGINYPLLYGELEAADVTKAWGNRYGALPYTVIVGRDQRVTLIKRGEITYDEARSALEPLL